MPSPMLPLEDVAEVAAGNPAPQESGDFAEDGHLFMRMQDVGRDHHTADLRASTDRVSDRSVSKYRLRLFPTGSVLIPKSGASVNLNHRAMLGCDAYVVSHLAVVVPNRERLLPEYLYFWSLSYDPRNQAQTTSLPSLPLSLIKAALIPVPSIVEQRRIVDILSRAEGIVRLRRDAEKKAAELIPALFPDMFGDPATNSKGLPTKKINDICDLVRGSSPRPQGDPKFFGGSVPRLMIADVTRDGVYVTPKIDSLTAEGAKKSRPMKCGEVVMAVSGAVGLPAILAIDACIHDGFVGFRSLSEEVSPEYFYNFLAAYRHLSVGQAVGATFQNLKTDQIREWLVPLPPQTEQKHFNRVCADVRSLEIQQSAAAATAQATFDSLLARAFTSGD